MAFNSVKILDILVIKGHLYKTILAQKNKIRVKGFFEDSLIFEITNKDYYRLYKTGTVFNLGNSEENPIIDLLYR